MRKLLPGEASEAALTASRTSWRIGTMRWDTTPVSVELVKKFVMQESTHTVVSARIDFRDSERVDIFVQGITWQPDIRGRSRQFVGFI